MEKTFKRWLSDKESWIGIFENQDLSSSRCGERIALCFDNSQWKDCIIGQTHSPDSPYIGLG